MTCERVDEAIICLRSCPLEFSGHSAGTVFAGRLLNSEIEGWANENLSMPLPPWYMWRIMS